MRISDWSSDVCSSDLPEPEAMPTGADIVRDYLVPLAAVPAIKSNLKPGAQVTAITRLGHDKLADEGRGEAPFVVRYVDASGEQRLLARAVSDASGAWQRPNPSGIDGLPVPGEAEAAERIAYGIPDGAGRERARYAGRRVLVIGGGHSAINAALALMELQGEAPGTEIFWALRRDSVQKLLGGGLNDQLPARGALGLAAKRAIDEGRLTLLATFAVDRLPTTDDETEVEATLAGRPFSLKVDRIVVATGFRPDLSFLGELRVALDPAVEAPPVLAPLIDPNLHSCGTVPPHGIEELAHPEPGFTIVGAKSYGRAPTFLMATGYEQVRSVVAQLAGDRTAAREMRLVLPETGVCNSNRIAGPAEVVGAAGCCGGPAPATVAACCVEDADVKAQGGTGCGCA